MGNWVKFELRGLDELDGVLADLPPAMGEKVLRAALTKAAQPLVDYAMVNANFVDRSGRTRASIKVRPMRRRTYGIEIAVGPTSPAAHLIEFGTAPHRIDAKSGSVLAFANVIFGKEVMHPGAKPKPFMRPAFDAKAVECFRLLADHIWEELRLAVEKLRRRADKGTLSNSQQEALS